MSINSSQPHEEHPPSWSGQPTVELKHLKEDRYKRITVIWFEAWRYQQEAVPIVPLLHEIRSQITWKKRFFQKLGRKSKDNLELTVRGALLSLDKLTEQVGFSASGVFDAAESIETRRHTHTLPTNQLRELLNEAIIDLLGGEKDARLVIMVDDLDRCSPEAAFRLLEGIKIYLNLPSCVFVLGLNQREIERAIEKCIPSAADKDADTQRLRAHEYLEKLCSLIWRLPVLSDAQTKGLVLLWLKSLGSEALAQRIADVAAHHSCLPANPRRIKAVCNAILHLVHRLPNGTAVREADAEELLVCACLTQFHPELLSLLQRHGNAFFEELRRWAKRDPAALREKALHPAFKTLTATYEAQPSDESNPTPSSSATRDLFADPTHSNVFRLQSLLASEDVSFADLKKFLFV